MGDEKDEVEAEDDAEERAEEDGVPAPGKAADGEDNDDDDDDDELNWEDLRDEDTAQRADLIAKDEAEENGGEAGKTLGADRAVDDGDKRPASKRRKSEDAAGTAEGVCDG